MAVFIILNAATFPLKGVETARNAPSAILRYFFLAVFPTGAVNCDHQVGAHPIGNGTGYFPQPIFKGRCIYYPVKE